MTEETTNPTYEEQASAQAAADTQAAAEAQAAADAAAPAKRSSKQVKARLLQDCEHGKANDLVTLPEAEAKTLEAAGVLDTHKSAVAYAASLEQNQPAA